MKRQFNPNFDVLQDRIAPGQIISVGPTSEYVPPGGVVQGGAVPSGQVMISPMDPASGLDYDKALVSPMDPVASPPSGQSVSPVYGPGDFQSPCTLSGIA